MIYTLRHRTTYRYARPVRFARCSLRLKPRDGEGQSVLASAVTIEPSPASAVTRRDYFGIEALGICLDTPHAEFVVEANSRVAVDRPAPPEPESGPAWDAVRDAVVASRDLSGQAPVHFLFPSARVPLVPAVTDYARASFRAGRSAYGAAHDLMRRIRADFRFDSAATAVDTPLADAFRLRAGVCQDFAHVHLGLCRTLGIPARYVSGYFLNPARRPGENEDSHAWIEAWLPGAGWLAYDPTHARVADDRYITLAVGRDYADIRPVSGTYRGAPTRALRVDVCVRETRTPVNASSP